MFYVVSFCFLSILLLFNNRHKCMYYFLIGKEKCVKVLVCQLFFGK